MADIMHAHLKTEGTLDYRDCQITYYTYTMFTIPDKYRVNVSVYLQSPSSQIRKTLNLDDSFKNEKDAINYGIEQGKKYIDQNYASGKIVDIIPTQNKPVKGPVVKTTAPTKAPIKKKDQS